MRSALDLLELPYSFFPTPLLDSEAFASAAHRRGVGMESMRLEALHRLGLLVPLFRFRRPVRDIGTAFRRGNDHRAHVLARWTPRTRSELLEAKAEGLLYDAATERPRSRRSLAREIGDYRFAAGGYLYSPYQLACLGPAEAWLPHLKWMGTHESFSVSIDVPRSLRDQWVSDQQTARDAVLAITALDSVYQPGIVRSLTTPMDFDVDAYLRWRSELAPDWLLVWLGVDADWIRDRAKVFLHAALRHDVLGDWNELIAAGSSKQWDELRGVPRLVMEMRLAGELLLRYYDRLVEESLAEPLPSVPRTRTAYDLRLKRRRTLDALLTDFGLSPHPQLVLVVEGATERLLVPRVMEKLGLRADEDFISIQDAEGVRTNLGPLLAYLAPRPGTHEDERYFRPDRPLTRFLIAFDPEGPMRTPEEQERRRQTWIDRLLRVLPAVMRTDVVRGQIDRLVEIETWNTRGENFEFAHFTDLELARAIGRADQRARRPTQVQLVERLSRLRAGGGNVKALLSGSSWGKVDLAEELWPTLERKLDRALARGTEARLPVVRVIDHATRMAQEFGRGNTVIALDLQ